MRWMGRRRWPAVSCGSPVWRHQASGQNVVWFMDNATLISGTFTNPAEFPDTNWKLVGPR